MTETALFKRDAIDYGLPNPRGDTVVTVNIALVAVAVVMVVARFWTRIVINNMLGLDDWCVLTALLIAITMTGLFYGETKNGFGLHRVDVDQEHFLQAWKYFLACQVLYKAAALFAKLSMLFLYLRIFSSRNFRMAAYAVMFICVGTAIGTILPTIFACHPIEKAWIPTVPGRCIWTPGIWYASSSINIATDVMIIVLPIAQIRSLKLPKAQKIGLAVLFSLGFFIIATCAVRIATLAPAATAKDSTYYQAQNNLWLGIEVNTSIICTCIPPLKATIMRFFPRIFRGSSYGRPTVNYRTRSGTFPLSSNGTSVKGGNNSSFPTPLSPTHGYSNTVVTGGSKSYPISESNSDEVVMLDDMAKTGRERPRGKDDIVKQTDVEVSYLEVP
ncbi:hypothetical protein G647_06039 [Cladophialophora carrionii CBS 160.54]|uniref:Rhodopsin domain-containing protein n=1 Tax=Cladophialophora carrionii CBS 160.54 TaxID=1279043 RepID=V9D4Z8_9EURO|nr:uncharacterized protein G647_06039 [Cladophialophora carrionii CBS 160.54]ETI21969.1 hypothetical protein G647_06039 [Cladophialophora carrionii CBS 160.54]